MGLKKKFPLISTINVLLGWAVGDDMTLIGLKPDTSYAVSVSAVNQVGVGTAAKVRVMTSPGTG